MDRWTYVNCEDSCTPKSGYQTQGVFVVNDGLEHTETTLAMTEIHQNKKSTQYNTYVCVY